MEKQLALKDKEVQAMREKWLIEQARHKSMLKQWEQEKQTAKTEREAALERESQYHMQEQLRARYDNCKVHQTIVLKMICDNFELNFGVFCTGTK